MRKQNKITAMAAAVLAGCSSDDDFQTISSSTNAIINFDNAPADVMASDEYGVNLYSYSATLGVKQVTTGYITQIGESGTYIQFPINYIGYSIGGVTGQLREYEYWNGGFAISNFHNMTQGDYLNQCSVYYEENGEGGHSGKNFAVAFGYNDWYNDSEEIYDKCAKIYLTNEDGYRVTTENQPVTGEAKTGKFNSLWVCNTTYSYLVMKNGNSFTQGSLEKQGGWFKVVFIGFDENNKKTGQIDYYLANFDSDQPTTLNGILEGWHEVTLGSELGENVSTVVINFEGSDTGEYGLNTPAYVAIDDIDVTVN